MSQWGLKIMMIHEPVKEWIQNMDCPSNNKIF